MLFFLLSAKLLLIDFNGMLFWEPAIFVFILVCIAVQVIIVALA